MKIFIKKFKIKGENCRSVFDLFFKASFILFLILFLAEAAFPGFATNWFNPIWFLLLAIFFIIINFYQEKI